MDAVVRLNVGKKRLKLLLIESLLTEDNARVVLVHFELIIFIGVR